MYEPQKRAGTLQFEAVSLRQKIENVHRRDAVCVSRHVDDVLDDDDLFERIAETVQRRFFLRGFFDAGQTERRLNVITPTPQIGDEIDFQLAGQLLPSGVALPLPNHSHVDGEAPASQFVIDYVFHNVVFFRLPEAQPGVAQPYVLEIILQRRADVFPSLHVVAPR